MAFAYNTMMHTTIMRTPFMLTYGVEYRTQCLLANQPTRKTASGLHLTYKLVHQIATQHAKNQINMYARDHNKKSCSPYLQAKQY